MEKLIPRSEQEGRWLLQKDRLIFLLSSEQETAKKSDMLEQAFDSGYLQEKRWPLLLSYRYEHEVPYCATQVWRLHSITQFTQEAESAKRKELSDLLNWQKSLLACLSSNTDHRVMELRYNRWRNAQNGDSKFEILLVAHAHGESEAEAMSSGEQFWLDINSLLTSGVCYYQFAAVQELSAIARTAFAGSGFTYGKELKRGCDTVQLPNIGGSKLGFGAQTTVEKPVLTVCLPKPLGNPSDTSNLSVVLYQSLCNLSLRLVMARASFSQQEQKSLATLEQSFRKGEQVRFANKNQDSDPQLWEACRAKIANWRDNPAYFTRVTCLATAPISRTLANLVATCLWGKSANSVQEIPLDQAQLEEREMSSYPFTEETERFSLVSDEAEANCLLRLPHSLERCVGIEEKKLSHFYVPSDLPEAGCIMGYKHNIFGRGLIRLSDRARSQHLYILGQTGTGKSTLMLSMLKSQIEAGAGVGLIDPHGDLYEQVLNQIPEERMDDVILFDPSDTEHVAGFNPLETDPRQPMQKTMLVDAMLEVFDKLYDLRQTGGPIFEMYMRNGMLLAMDDMENPGTVMDIPRILTDEDFRHEKMRKCKDELVVNFWHREAERAGGEASLANMAPYINSKLNAFVYNDYLRPIVSQKRSFYNFRQIMDSGKIFIANLSKGVLGSRNADMLGLFLINRMLLAALSRQDIASEKRRNFTLYIDEFQNFTTDNIAHIFAEARKFNLSLICANQNLSQLKDNVRHAALGTVGNMLCFRPGIHDVEVIGPWFSSQFDKNELLTLPNYNAAARIITDGHPCTPFLFETLPIVKAHNLADAVKFAFQRKLAVSEPEKKAAKAKREVGKKKLLSDDELYFVTIQL
jgi:hypothetical protein